MNLDYRITCGDNQLVLKDIDYQSIDACITDPPYGMGMDIWDKNVPPKKVWQEVYSVLKPGAFLLSFCSPELYHRMAINIEDAGFIPADMIFWIVTTKMAKKNKLKPAHEPIMVAQKPYKRSIQKNKEEWGCGAIDIDNARIPWDKEPPSWLGGGFKRRAFGKEAKKVSDFNDVGESKANPKGRYPSNVIGYLDEAEHQKYFYAPRVTRKERGEYNDHPTPKPINLMRYLCRVYSPEGGIVLDPFCGSGSTGVGALQEGRKFVGIDQSSHYCEIASRRIEEHCQSLPFDKLFEYD